MILCEVSRVGGVCMTPDGIRLPCLENWLPDNWIVCDVIVDIEYPEVIEDFPGGYYAANGYPVLRGGRLKHSSLGTVELPIHVVEAYYESCDGDSIALERGGLS